MLNPYCESCEEYSELVGGDYIYPHRKDLYSLQFYYCKCCGAYVGCHKGTTKPLGILANKQLRASKSKAHACFDPLWRSGEMTRKEAYTWLSEQLNINKDDCHIGMFNEEQCEAVVQVVIGR